jgi:alpha-ketoglutaric semialdehyde dehydrogenase
MLYSGIRERFQAGLQQARAIPGVELAGQSTAKVASTQAATSVLVTNSIAFLKNEALVEELFGPATLIVSCSSTADLERIARALPGQLTATLHGTEQDLEQHRELVTILQGKAGRLIFNGFPTGVEVCPSMHHGGPYPATTDVHFTSVGTAAIQRFARPVCLQNFPDPALPVELQNSNPRRLWRMVDGELTRDAL